jgi:cytochrome d ubiquinol oxidase subunit II
MEITWYAVIALMLVVYAVLDGFDFGAGILHLFVAKTEAERRTVLAAIGPVWDGNEVWLIAAGGVLFFAFPRAYSAALAGLYLPLMMVLWLLLLRGISIEFRSKVDHPLWHAAFDVVFAVSSAVMAVVLGVALGNVVRGVPLDASGWFHEDLFTDFRARGAHLGALDLYTVLVGVFAAVSLAAHGATFLVWKTTGEVAARSARLAGRLWPATVAAGAILTVATLVTQPEHFATFLRRPALWPLPAVAVVAAAFAYRAIKRGEELRAFVGSCVFVGGLLVATAGTLFPLILRSTVAPAYSLDAWSAASAHATLTTGLYILMPALVLAAGYFVFLYRSFHGKVTIDDGHDDYS